MASAGENVEPPMESLTAAAAIRSRASDWLWRPWYAKLWWTAIPVYWVGAMASLNAPSLTGLYESALAGFLNVMFFPVTAVLVLGVGFARERLNLINWGDPANGNHSAFNRRPGGFLPDPRFDPFDARSGDLWIGNPNSPYNSHRD